MTPTRKEVMDLVEEGRQLIKECAGPNPADDCLEHYLIRSMADTLTRLIEEPGHVPADVARLVVAARLVGEQSYLGGLGEDDALRELDRAAEAFASRVPWDDEPEGLVKTDAALRAIREEG